MTEIPGVEPAGPPELRIGHAERADAMRALDEHFAAGRLGVQEYGDRSATAGAATHRSDLVALFRDLPAPHPALPGPGSSPVATPVPPPPGELDRVRFPAAGLVMPVLLAVGLVALVVFAHNPAGFAAFPLLFFLVSRMGPHRRP